MFTFFKKKTPAEPAGVTPVAQPQNERQDERSWREKLGFGAPKTVAAPEPPASVPPPAPEPVAEVSAAERTTWLDKVRSGLRKTGSSITQVFTGTRIDDALYEELEEALLMADAGVKATQFLLDDLRRRVKDAKVTEPAAVKGLL